MKNVKMKLTFPKTVTQEEEVVFDRWTETPNWTVPVQACEKCGWDFESDDRVIVAISRGRLFYFHDSCFDEAFSK